MADAQLNLFAVDSKRCSNCKEVKSLDKFRSYKEKYRASCRDCDNEINKIAYHKNPQKSIASSVAWIKANPERKKEINKKYIDNNKEKKKERDRIYYENNREIIRQQQAEKYKQSPEKAKATALLWAKENPDKCNARAKKREADKINATPSWANPLKILDIYKECREKNKNSDIVYSVDHVVPLRGKLVCGLHVENNLEIIPLIDNIRKSNKFIPG